jgi:hypothetical protein
VTFKADASAAGPFVYRRRIFVIATLIGAALGSLWNLPVFGQAYKSFIALFMDPAAPLGAASTMVLLAFVMGVPRICVP